MTERLRRHLDALATSEGRSWKNPKILGAVAESIERYWLEMGYQVKRQRIPDLPADYVNLIGFPDSRGWEGEPFLLGAHYDASEGTPGADDNASGVAVLLEVSRLLSHGTSRKRPVVFVAFTLEEPPHFQTPRQGSWVLARQLQRQGIRLAGALVLEMVGTTVRRRGASRIRFP